MTTNRQDVLIRSDSRGLYDLEIDGADFASAYGFETAIPTSFFTDARASETQVQEAHRRRGWAGNILYVDQGRQLGGLLWILDQARIVNDTINFAKRFAEDSLQWMLDDGVALAVQIDVERTAIRAITISTDILAIDNTVQRYITLWRATDLTRILSP